LEADRAGGTVLENGRDGGEGDVALTARQNLRVFRNILGDRALKFFRYGSIRRYIHHLLPCPYGLLKVRSAPQHKWTVSFSSPPSLPFAAFQKSA
jgi:hypothetical protein